MKKGELKLQEKTVGRGCRLFAVIAALLTLCFGSSAFGMGLDFGGGGGTTPPPDNMSSVERLVPLCDFVNSATDVALDSTGKIYIADSYGNRIVILSQSGALISSINNLAKPISVAVDEQGRVYVGNKDTGSVEVYDSDQQLLFKLGAGDGEFDQPNDIAIDILGNVYVVDKWNHIVKIYSSINGLQIGTLGQEGTGNGQFLEPLSIAYDNTTQELLVLDSAGGARIQFFSLNWNYTDSFSIYGEALGQVLWPQRIAVDLRSRIYISDSQLNMVLVYENNGDYVGFVNDLETDPFMIPMGLAIGAANKLYIASHTKSCVEVYGLYEDGVYGFVGMEIDPMSLTFVANEGGWNPAKQVLTVTNTGNISLLWQAFTEESWLTLSGLSHSNGIIPVGKDNRLNVAVDKTGLEPGVYEGNITFIGLTGLKEVVDVKLEVKPSAILSISEGSLTFFSDTGVNPLSQFISIANQGSATLSWSTVADQSWISFDTPSGIIADSGSAPDTVEVLIDVTGLPAGTYTGEITVSGINAYQSPATIAVNLTLNQTAYLYTVMVKAGSDGSLDPLTPAPQMVHYGETSSFTFNADDKCYVASIAGCGIDLTNTNNTVTTRTVTTGPITNSCIVYATFGTDAMRLSVSTVGNGSGKVVSAPSGIDCPGDCQNLYDPGEHVTLTAEPLGSSKFGGWTGECTSMDFVCEVTMDQARSVEAKFNKFPWMILMPALMYNAQQAGQ